MTTKHDVDMARINQLAKRESGAFNTVARILNAATILGALYIVMHTLENLAAAKPEAIEALALLVEKLKLTEIFGTISTLLAGGGWLYERRGKKRLLRKMDECRQQLEKNDPGGRTSSNLDKNGHTPRNKETV